MNPFQELYDACNTGHSLGKYARLPDFPRIIDLELTSACNFRCLMCPVGNMSMKRKAEFMKPAVYRRIVEQCEEHGTALRFIGWGEPLLHPHIVAFVRRASNGGLLTHINTNGSKLTPGLFTELKEAGLTSLKFSFQGVDRQSYAEMRQTDWFEELVETIEMARSRRGEDPFPWLQVSTSITYEDEKTVEAFKERVAPLVDQVSVGKTIFGYMDLSAVRMNHFDRKRLERLAAEETADKVHPEPCPEVYDKLSIHADGSVRVCCNDYDGVTDLGNVIDTPLVKMWRHPTIEAYRKRLAQREYDMPLCKDCWDYQSLTKGAAA